MKGHSATPRQAIRMNAIAKPPPLRKHVRGIHYPKMANVKDNQLDLAYRLARQCHPILGSNTALSVLDPVSALGTLGEKHVYSHCSGS